MASKGASVFNSLNFRIPSEFYKVQKKIVSRYTLFRRELMLVGFDEVGDIAAADVLQIFLVHQILVSIIHNNFVPLLESTRGDLLLPND